MASAIKNRFSIFTKFIHVILLKSMHQLTSDRSFDQKHCMRK